MHQHQRHVHRGVVSESQSPGCHFRCIRFIRFGSWSESNESNESNASKVGPKARTSDALDPLAASEPEARASGVVSESKVLGATFDSLDSFD